MQEFIVQLEAELEHSLKRLESAIADRERAAKEEAKWDQDVRALKNLITRRRHDAAHGGTIDTMRVSTEDSSTAADPAFVSGFEELNRVEWTYQQIVKSGDTGLLPTEIYEASKKAGFFMHKNYGYVATTKLLERGRIEKIGKRYRVKEKEPAEAGS